MADVYVKFPGFGLLDGSSWANAYATLAAACTGSPVAGNDFWISNNHAETSAAALTITNPGTFGTPCRVICVDDAVSAPFGAADIRATASITTTGAFGITLQGNAYYYGITFNCGTGASVATLTMDKATNNEFWFDTCNFNLLTSASTSFVALGSTTANTGISVNLNNCSMRFSAAGQGIQALIAGRLRWQNSVALSGGTVLTALIVQSASTRQLDFMADGVDFSAQTNSIVGAINSPITAQFRDCKVSSGSLAATPNTPASAQIDFINCSSSSVNYTSTRIRYQGTLTTDNAVVRTGGASDGTTAISWKIVSSANAKWRSPFECFEIDQWIDTPGAHVVSVEVLTSGVTLTNADAWANVFYLGTASAPLASLATSAPSNALATPANLTASTAAWTGLGSPSPQKITVAFTTALAGWVRVKVYIGKASATVYVDPLVSVS